KPSVERHETRRSWLDDNGGLEVGWLRRGDGGHVHGPPESVGGRHLVHVHRGLVVLVGKTVCLLLRVLRVLHLTIVGLHLGWVAGIVGVLSLRYVRGIVCERGRSHCVCFHCLKS